MDSSINILHAANTLTSITYDIILLQSYSMAQRFLYAATTGANIVVEGGYHIVQPSSPNHRSKYHAFENMIDLLSTLAAFIDIGNAAAANPADKEMIFDKIRVLYYPAGEGIEYLNVKVSYYPTVQSTACGDLSALRLIIRSKEISYQPIAVEKYAALRRETFGHWSRAVHVRSERSDDHGCI